MNRRNFLQWSVLLYLSAAAFIADMLRRIFIFVIGPKYTKLEQLRILEERIKTLEKTAKLEKLRFERLTSEKLFIANLSELNQYEAKTFIDFNLSPGMAYLNSKNEVLMKSAICPHLGCSVRQKIEGGKIHCPCHNAYFDSESGKNIAGPAQRPLDELKFVIEEEKVFLVS